MDDQVAIDLIASYPRSANTWVHREPKPSGGFRRIISPNHELNDWLKAANGSLYKLAPAWPWLMHGGIKKRSYVSFARPHVGRQCVVTVDISKCFDSIRIAQVAEVIKGLQISDAPATELAGLLCFRKAPAQGYATSNLICNLVLRDTLLCLEETFSVDGLVITNYVDDIAVSGNIRNPSEIINTIAVALSARGLAINKLKVRVMPASRRQVICGLMVNRRITLTRKKQLQLFSAVATKAISDASLNGWLANLHSINPIFEQKLRMYAGRKGYELKKTG